MLGPTGHIDTFSRDGLPPIEQQPDFLLDGLYLLYMKTQLCLENLLRVLMVSVLLVVQ